MKSAFHKQPLDLWQFSKSSNKENENFVQMYYTTASTFCPSPLKGVDIPINSQVSPLPTNPSGVRMGKSHKKKVMFEIF